MSLSDIKRRIKAESNAEHAETMKWFFKTGKGDYGEGDVFTGIKVPVQRKIARDFSSLRYNDIEKLISSVIHEERLIALLILVYQYEKGSEDEKEKIYRFYLKNLKGINNWDLVDLSAPKIVGNYLLNRNKKILYQFAKLKNLWKRRIAIISTYTFIRDGKFTDTLKISGILLKDKHDLIHKAVGWMLREVGNRNLMVEEKFLRLRYKKIPRTMLRYAIEKFPESKRKKYLEGKV